MKLASLSALAALSLVLSACGTQPSAPESSSSGVSGPVTTVHRNGQLEMKLASGSYSCENGLSVQIHREMRNNVNYRLHVGWNGSRYQLERDPSYSGLPRFEDTANGLVWIDLPWKGLLLDAKTNKPLANECHSGSV